MGPCPFHSSKFQTFYLMPWPTSFVRVDTTPCPWGHRGHDGVWKLGDAGGIECPLKSSFICADIIGVGADKVVSAQTRRAVRTNGVGYLHDWSGLSTLRSSFICTDITSVGADERCSQCGHRVVSTWRKG
jgi:hypothetical protein